MVSCSIAMVTDTTDSVIDELCEESGKLGEQLPPEFVGVTGESRAGG